MVRGIIPPRLTKAKVRRYGLTSKATFRAIPLMMISINKEHDIERPWNILRESCYHRIECFAVNFLAALIWRRPLNSAVLTAPTHRGPKKVSDGTSIQVVVWMINKWRAKIVQRELYNVRDPQWRRDRELKGETL